MQRETWSFEYPAAQLAEAANRKILFHDERFEYWKKRRDIVINTIRSEGIEVDDSVALLTGHAKARDWELSSEVLVRNDLRKELTDCTRKLAYHTERRDTYDGWRQALHANPTARQALDIDDWLFFFGRDTAREH